MKPHTRRLTVGALATLAVTGTLLSPANSAETEPTDGGDTSIGNVTGGDINLAGIPVPEAIQAQSNLKEQAAAAYWNAKNGLGTIEDAVEASRVYEETYPSAVDIASQTDLAGAVEERLDDIGAINSRSAVVASTESLAVTASATTARTLLVTHSPQSKNYWCGPASGRMILSWLAAGNSAYDGSKQVQTNIANDNHMKTETNGVTSWASGRFRIGLNRWLKGTSTGWYVDQATPTAAQVKSFVTYDIDNGHPMGADTVEIAGGNHYNNHPANQTIGHWIIANGYDNNGDTTKFMDPSTSVWSAASASFSANTTTFTNRYLQNNGITW
ncbi:C39 family peptidase [Nocardioides sp.]|uniref:C39 family peptidase n=1 Tax=Nocardioides sp. TaxID=35761 RepID=UPI00260343E8|nr:C39 family peptidase [Nocardioides sp.]